MAKKKSVRKKAAKRSVARPKGMGTKKSRPARISVRASRPVKCDWVKAIFVRLCAIAFILFVITIWPAAMNLVHSINPWWFLVAAIVFWAIHITRRRCM